MYTTTPNLSWTGTHSLALLLLQVNRRLFEQNVQRTMRGGTLNGVYFEQCLK
jgi:hypothetical protein